MVLTAGFAHAGLMHWMIDPDSIVAGTDYAMLKVVGPEGGNGTYLVDGYFPEYNTYLPNTSGSWSDPVAGGVWQWSVVNPEMMTSEYKFIIELYNSSGTQLSVFNEYYGDLIAASGAYSAGGGPDSLGIFVFSNQNIPEPTSGMLALFGLGLLALRRKQKKA